MVLSTESTIRELCPSNTPTSQFSSLHFIASKAIGAKSIERRAQTLDTSSFGRQFDARVPARFGADCRSAGGFHTADGEREYLTGVDTTPRTARRSGGWRLSTHLSRYLIAIIWGLDLATRKPSAVTEHQITLMN
ncbi:unnamed protein product [Pieris macdunnoughi]|uniref:Uncharacterized protein n=1 Tax=Pieris macdunnoughi TaxID=345717 RepID=A0A821MG55_9NEOP|nr:unnamed protein product [Pieris macdunnoughi]